ncbi:CCA tRNA nucleotidyltransferase [Nitrososphaera sp.]|uniref:CCA tRNA nucleotidyltransferase n=1 Tax=Nitrososphaera sp. TaxID=1971748 RepID=UPI00182E3506|nr:CCA tRNA nucleotidyltransferase [Nitrososphaera sp.]NWG38154.1 CCA tRNA nucleotidyltransferase [Nitrososphaera sp.]
MTDVLARALAACEPTPAEATKLDGIAKLAKDLVEQAKTPEVKEVVFGGSYAKGTWLRGDADIDIFVKIDPAVDEQTFEKIGVEMGKKALAKFRPTLRYSDHPYVEAFVRGVRINVVPCYDVERGKWKSAADRSTFHTEYVTRTLGAEKRAHVRLLKKFLKSAGIYGAEISTGGFSGYVSEVLVAKYGSLEGVLAAASEFRQGQVIAVGDYDPDFVKGFSSPLVIIDPVDPRRNLGTAVSPECAGRLVLAARAFLNKPSVRFFSRQKPRVNKKLYPHVLVAEFSHRRRSPDTIWGQMKRSQNAVAKQLELAGFAVIRSTCTTDEETRGAFAFLLESHTLAPYTTRKGPEIFRAKDVASFVAKANGPLVMWADREMRVSTIVRRKETDAGRLVRALLNNDGSGVARGMITGNVKIYTGNRRSSPLVKQAVDELASTEGLIFGS